MRSFLGPEGYWLVIVAGLLSMLSALQANLMAASSMARTMGADRTLPQQLEGVSARYGTPAPALKVTGVLAAFLIVAVPDVPVAGAVSSLIFLASFALAHGVAYLVRKRAHNDSPYRTPPSRPFPSWADRPVLPSDSTRPWPSLPPACWLLCGSASGRSST